jgi:hypothetical protein
MPKDLILLLGALAILAVFSGALASVLFGRWELSSKSLIAAGVVPPVVAFAAWGIVPALIWFLPVLLLWQAAKKPDPAP